MDNEKCIYYKGLGEVFYYKNSRAKNISIRINSEGRIRVTVPRWCSYHRAEQFVIEKQHWILNKTHEIKRKSDEKLVWRGGESIEYWNGKLFFESGTGNEFSEMQVGNNFIVELPALYDPNSEEWRNKLLKILGAIGFRESKSQLPVLLHQYSQSSGLKYTRVTVRRMRTRWGSCSSKNSISLNSALFFMPEELIKYVCLHELVHTVHKNHSQNFWNALVAILPDAMQLRKQLRHQPIIA